MKYTDPAKGRAVREDGKPLVSVLEKLKAEVSRTEQRAEKAKEDLRRWLLSHEDDCR